MTNYSVAVVLLNWNGKADTIECLKSLQLLNDKDVAIIVCDNDSKDSSVSAIVEWATTYISPLSVCVVSPECRQEIASYLTVIPTGFNRGFAGGNNVGIRFALNTKSIQHVWILNNDTIVCEDSLENLRTRMTEGSSLGICGSTLVYMHKRDTVQAIGVKYNLALGRGVQLGWGCSLNDLPSQSKVESQLSYVPGASMLVSRLFIETVGFMSEDYFLYFEELDWSLRNRNRFGLGWAPASIVYHSEGASIGTRTDERGSNLSLHYKTVNLLKIVRKFAPIYLPVIFVKLKIKSVILRLKGDASGFAVMHRAIKCFFDRAPPNSY